MDQVTQQNAALVEQMAAAMVGMRQQTADLRNLFKAADLAQEENQDAEAEIFELPAQENFEEAEAESARCPITGVASRSVN